MTHSGLHHYRRTMATLSRYLLSRNGGVVPAIPLEEVPLFYSGKKRTIYANAVQQVLDQPDLMFDARVKAFVKCERYNLSDGDPVKAPRIIQARSPNYNVSIARYLKAIEHSIYSMKLPRGWQPCPDRVIAKGLNQRQRAGLVRRKWSRFSKPHGVVLDCSKFDAHVEVEHLRACHDLYMTLCPSKEFRLLLNKQFKNKCSTRSGLKYTTHGKRMSGDMDTALGNCLIMIALTCSVMRRKLPRGAVFDVVDDGDDLFLIIEERDLSVLDGIHADFSELGFKVKVEQVVTDLEEIDFCQSRLVSTATGWTFVRNPLKVMGNCFSSERHFQEPKGAPRVMKSIAWCELVLARGVPVLQEMFRSALEALEHHKFSRLELSSSLIMRVRREGVKLYDEVKDVPVDHGARASFAKAFGISIPDQLVLEKRMRADARSWAEALPLIDPTEYAAEEFLPARDRLYRVFYGAIGDRK